MEMVGVEFELNLFPFLFLALCIFLLPNKKRVCSSLKITIKTINWCANESKRLKLN